MVHAELRTHSEHPINTSYDLTPGHMRGPRSCSSTCGARSSRAPAGQRLGSAGGPWGPRTGGGGALPAEGAEPGGGVAPPQQRLQWRPPPAGDRGGRWARPASRSQGSPDGGGLLPVADTRVLGRWRRRSAAPCAARPSSVVAGTSTVASTSDS